MRGRAFEPTAPLVRAADAMIGALAVVLGELAVASVAGRAELAGPWELKGAVLEIGSLAWLAVLPAAWLGAALVACAERASEGGGRRRWRIVVALAAAAFGFAVAWGVATGRHLSAPPIRALFAAAVALAGATVAFFTAPPIGRTFRERPRAAAAAGALAVVAVELANRFVLPRLYPAFHLGLGVLAVLLAAVVALAWRRDPSGAPRTAAALGLALAAAACATFAARKLALDDNLRLVYLERAPLLARGILLGARLAPPPPLDDATAAPDVASGRRALEWRGRDVVLISVDALRADHVGAYGYARPTTPRFDALAREGALFEHAYCPTPHTSYSVTSLMTGKNMRPLLLQGLGADSETFAKLLRTYGYRTAAFYPPAVFFIDPERFEGFRDRGLDFEYRKVEFADPALRTREVTEYLARRHQDRRVLLWVHLFEPHEPYVEHPEHPFGGRDVDRYDSEIAAADDGIGAIVDAVRAVRPQAVIVVTADHGEEFGEHGGRYHGTTVYEEQVHVPLLVVAPGSVAPRRIRAPVQTIDLLPTVLAALDIPRPARVRGHDLGPMLRDGDAGAVAYDPTPSGDAAGQGFAFAETDEQTLLAEGTLRLVCERRIGACALYDLERDPGETRDASAAHLDRFEAMKRRLRSIEASHGRFELAGLRTEGHAWPEPIRRGIAGDGDAAPEVAALLDDAEVLFRRKSAEVLFWLRRREVAPELRLALSRDEDDEVKRWCALALTRLGEGAPRTVELLDDADPKWRRLAALALAESGDGRGGSTLVKWWESDRPDFAVARDVLAALARIRSKEAVWPLVRSLDDVRLRPYVARALGDIGEPFARRALADHFADERYEPARVALAEAIVKLGGKYELAPPLARFLGTPDPLPGGLGFAARAGILENVGGPRERALGRLRHGAERGVELDLVVPRGGNGTGARVLVRGRSVDDRPAEVRIGPSLAALHPTPPKKRDDDDGPHVVADLDPRRATTIALPPAKDPVERAATLPEGVAPATGGFVHLVVYASSNASVDALAVVPLADEIPPPPPEPWDGPKGDEADEPD